MKPNKGRDKIQQQFTESIKKQLSRSNSEKNRSRKKLHSDKRTIDYMERDRLPIDDGFTGNIDPESFSFRSM